MLEFCNGRIYHSSTSTRAARGPCASRRASSLSRDVARPPEHARTVREDLEGTATSASIAAMDCESAARPPTVSGAPRPMSRHRPSAFPVSVSRFIRSRWESIASSSGRKVWPYSTTQSRRTKPRRHAQQRGGGRDRTGASRRPARVRDKRCRRAGWGGRGTSGRRGLGLCQQSSSAAVVRLNAAGWLDETLTTATWAR